MTIQANLNQAAGNWGADCVYLGYGPEGGPFTVVSLSAGLPVNVVAGTVQVSAPLAVSQSGNWTVQPGNTPNTTPWLFTQTPVTSGGCSMDSYISSGAANQDQHPIKGSAGQLYGYALFNTTASVRYVKVYNLASPTSASTPVIRIMLPANGGANMPVGDSGLAFSTAIAIRITTGPADNDTGAASANDVLANFFYK
jgi:hypothetical protein